MNTLQRRTSSLPRIPLAVLGLTIAVVVGGRVVATSFAPIVASPATSADDDGPGQPDSRDGQPALTDPLDPAAVATTDEDLARIRANITFWDDRFRANPRDFVSATRLAASSIELARATGDVSQYVAADRAVDEALAANPDAGQAQGYRGVILVALHRFIEARDHAHDVLADQPEDPVALATLGDSSLELGDVTTAARAYEQLRLVADSAAAEVRTGRLAFIEGRTPDAVAASRAALAAAIDEGLTGNGLAWYHYQLGETLLATGDRPGAVAAFDAALADDPHAYLARAGRARIAAAEGRIDDAIADLDAAVAIVPLPDLLARRADLLERRAGTGDARQATDDRATILVIAQLSGEAAGVYDRTLSLYLATTGIDVERALQLAQAEIAIRKDVYGYDALGWALLANGRATEADAALTTALGVGTRDAKILVHAGMAAAAVGDRGRARDLLTDGLALDSTFDPVVVERARTTLEGLR